MNLLTINEIAKEYGVSSVTVHKWIERYQLQRYEQTLEIRKRGHRPTITLLDIDEIKEKRG